MVFGLNASGRERPSGPTELLARFYAGDSTIAREDLSIEGDAWRIDPSAPLIYRMFELKTDSLEKCLLTYRATMRCADLQGRAFLEISCRVPGQEDVIGTTDDAPLRGSAGWAEYAATVRLKRRQSPDLIRLNVAAQGPGAVWLKTLELLKTPL